MINNKDLDKYVEDDNETYELLDLTPEECDKILQGLPNNVILDIIYYPDINEYNGRITVQLKPTNYRKNQ